MKKNQALSFSMTRYHTMHGQWGDNIAEQATACGMVSAKWSTFCPLPSSDFMP